MNAIFGLKFRITVGEKLIIAIANGTAMYLTSLPPPSVPKLVSDENTDDAKLVLLQKQLNETVKKNREIYQIEVSKHNFDLLLTVCYYQNSLLIQCYFRKICKIAVFGLMMNQKKNQVH